MSQETLPKPVKKPRQKPRKPQPSTPPAPAKARAIGRGAKLLCIDDAGLHRHYRPAPPRAGRLYCVREVYQDRGRTGVLLLGIQGPILNGLECGFYLTRFRWVHD